MIKKGKTTLLSKLFVFITVCILFQCSEDELLTSTTTTPENDPVTTAAAVSSDCGCTYVVPATANLIDGLALGLKPGNVICLTSGTAYKNLLFRNIKGSSTSPIIIKNCGGTVTLNGTGKPYTMKTELSQYFRITGGEGSTYGIKLNYGSQGLQLDKLSTNFEVDHLEIASPGFAGIMAKTDPNCDNLAVRGTFVMRDISLHHNYVHDSGGEGFYVGNSFYLNGMTTSCGIKFAHTIEGVKIYNNVVKNSGWEAIQVGSAPKGAEVYNNRIENFGVKNVKYQNNGVQFGEGAPAKFYGNYIKGGKGIGVIILGNAENFAYNNVIINTGGDGIFCDERTATGAGFTFINNTIINPGANGISLYAESVPNKIINNIIINPGKYTTYVYPRTGDDAYVYKLSKTMNAQLINNYFSRDITTAKFKNIAGSDYSLTSSSPALNKGSNISVYNIAVDYLLQPRLKGAAYDIGAYEY